MIFNREQIFMIKYKEMHLLENRIIILYSLKSLIVEDIYLSIL